MVETKDLGCHKNTWSIIVYLASVNNVAKHPLQTRVVDRINISSNTFLYLENIVAGMPLISGSERLWVNKQLSQIVLYLSGSGFYRFPIFQTSGWNYKLLIVLIAFFASASSYDYVSRKWRRLWKNSE